MALLFINDPYPDALLGIWKIEETVYELSENLILSANDPINISQIKNEIKQKQWLAARVLLKQILDQECAIGYDTNGKPFLIGQHHKISISHSGIYVVAVVDRNHETGVDIQRMSEKILGIKHKFMSDLELDDINSEHPDEKLHVYWGAKESLYKLYSRRKVDFIKNLKIQPFEFKNSGTIRGTIEMEHIIESHTLQYKKLENYMLVYVNRA